MIEFGYVALVITMATIIIVGYNYALKGANTPDDLRKKYLGRLWIGLFLWFAYTFAIAKSGLLQNLDLPPRFPIFLILPVFIFIGVFLYKQQKSPVIAALPKSWLIYYQSFRIVIESLFVASVGVGVLHPEVTFEGYNYDIVFAFTAPIVAYLVFNKKILSEKVALAWNYLGLAVISVIIFLFVTTMYFPAVWGSTESIAAKGFLEFPYVLVASFLMPSAVFMHVLSIIQLSRKDIA
ncbi:MAG: hypothetical protein ACPG49_11520 [Chitinophagales bacterium]